jgi:L-threonylcarbamoyladenylate synthase
LLLVKNGEVPQDGQGVYLQREHSPSRADITRMQMPSAPADYAAALYSKLHAADEAAHDWIAIDLPPETPDWEAVHDRLRRATSG